MGVVARTANGPQGEGKRAANGLAASLGGAGVLAPGRFGQLGWRRWPEAGTKQTRKTAIVNERQRTRKPLIYGIFARYR
jgi:hypothetical protein